MTMPTETQRILTDEMIAEIQAFIPRYPSKQAVTLPALHIVDHYLRHVPYQAVVEVAEILELAPAQVQDTLSFYGYFKQDAPHGRTRVWVCRSISCALRGGEAVLSHLCHKYHVEPGGTSADGKVTIELAECLGACEYAPCMLAGEQLVKNLEPDSAATYLDRLD